MRIRMNVLFFFWSHMQKIVMQEDKVNDLFLVFNFLVSKKKKIQFKKSAYIDARSVDVALPLLPLVVVL